MISFSRKNPGIREFKPIGQTNQYMKRNDGAGARTWTTWTTEEERVRAIAISAGEPRSARQIAEDAIVGAERTRTILHDLTEDGVLVKAERNGKTRFAVDQDHIFRESERVLREANDREELLEMQHDALNRLQEVEEPMHQRLIEHRLKIVDAALDRGAAE